MKEEREVTVIVMEDDYYALQSIWSLLAWHMDTRVVALATSPEQLLTILRTEDYDAVPSTILLDTEYVESDHKLETLATDVLTLVPDVAILCLSQRLDRDLVLAANRAGARGFLVKDEVRLSLANAIIFAQDHRFTVTPRAHALLQDEFRQLRAPVSTLPSVKPEISDRLQRVFYMWLIMGMPAKLISDELRLSEETVRSYIRDLYSELGVGHEHELGPLIGAHHRATRLGDPTNRGPTQ